MKRFFKTTKGGGGAKPAPQPAPAPRSAPSPNGGKAAHRADVRRRLREAYRQAKAQPASVSPAERWFQNAAIKEAGLQLETQGQNQRIRLTQPPKF